MSWEIDKKKYSQNPEKYQKVSKEDINVYKVGYIFGNIKEFYPLQRYRSFSYKPNEFNEEIKLVAKAGESKSLNSSIVIDEGYHSYSQDCFLKHITLCNHVCIYSKMEKYCEIGVIPAQEDKFCGIGKFVIPKGSEYYENEDGEIVSSNLIWTGKCLSIPKMGKDKLLKLKDIKLCVGI